MPLNNCKVTAAPTNSGLNPTQPSKPDQPSPSAVRARALLDMVNSVAENPLDPDTFEAVVRQSAYNAELARIAVINPRAASGKALGMQRSIRRILGNRNWSNVDVFFRESMERGRNLLNVMPMLTGDLGVDAARLDQTKRITRVRDEAFRLLDEVGVTSRADKEEFFVRMVEEGNARRILVGQDMGENARRVIQQRERNMRDFAQSLGVDRQRYARIAAATDEYVQVNLEDLTAARAIGADVDVAGGIGYFNRQLSEEFKFEVDLKNLDEADLVMQYKAGGRGTEQTIKKSRTSFDYIVEDEILVADRLGLMPDDFGDTVARRRLLDTLRDAVGQRVDEFKEVQRAVLQDVELAKRRLDEVVSEVDGLRRELNARIDREMGARIDELQAGHNNRFAERGRALDNYRANIGKPGYSETVANRMEVKLRDDLDTATAYLDKRLEAARKRFDAERSGAIREMDKRVLAQQQSYQATTDLLNKRVAAANAAVESARKAYSDANEQFMRQVMQPIDELNKLLSDEGALIDAVDKLTESQLDSLLASNALSKLPIPSHRVYEHLVRKYELPNRALSDIMITDPVKAHRLYVEQLSEEMARSNVAVSMIRGAMDNGWGVSAAQYAANRSKYRGYVNVGELIEAHHGVEGLQRMGLDSSKGLYVPAEVANGYASLVSIASNPGHIAFISEILKGIATFNAALKKSALTSTGFVMRNTFGMFVQAGAAGVNVSHIIPTIRDMLSYFGKGAAGLSDEKIYANGTMSVRDIFLQARAAGRIGTHDFLGVGSLGGVQRMVEMPEAVVRRLRYAAKSIAMGEPFSAVGHSVKAVDEFVTGAIAPFMALTVFMEDAMKLSILKTKLGRPGLNSLAQLVGSGELLPARNMDEALAHLDRYFVNFADQGSFDKGMSQYVFPFWMYMSRNLPMQVRNAIRHPGRYAAYLRVYNLMNQDSNRDREAPEAGFAQWALDGMGIRIRDPLNQGQWWSIQTETFDPIAEATSLLFKQTQNQLVSEQVESALPNVAGQKPNNITPGWVDWLSAQAQPIVKSAYAITTGRDPFSGRDLRQEADSLVGVGIEPALGLSPGQVRYLLENNLPYIRQINRLNPGTAFGVSEQRDAMGRIIREGQRSMFGAQRFDSDSAITGDDREAPALIQIARQAGMTTVQHDIPLNVQRAQGFYTNATRTFRAKASEAERNYRRESDEQRREELMQQHIYYETLGYKAEELANATEQWLQQRGIPLGRQAIEQFELNLQQTEGIQPDRGNLYDRLRQENLE